MNVIGGSALQGRFPRVRRIILKKVLRLFKNTAGENTRFFFVMMNHNLSRKAECNKATSARFEMRNLDVHQDADYASAIFTRANKHNF